MRVAVRGAGGKVGREVLAQITVTDDLTLAEGISGKDGSGLAAARLDADVLIDFSAPDAVMHLLNRLGDNPLPLVIGTTGFSAEQSARLRAEGKFRPILIGANFTPGFEAFRRAGQMLASALPDAGLTVAETYNAQKKPDASGTTKALVADLSGTDRRVATEIHRLGDTPGINELRFDLGVAEISLTLSVASRAAYAAGALAAARWLVGQPNGAYAPSDIS